MPRHSVSPQPKASEADAVGFNAKVLADWVNSLDPLSVQAALDQLAAASDTNAIHDNVDSEISAVTEKVSPVNADLVLIEDSADSNAKKRVQVGNLPGGGGGTTSFARTFALMGA